MTGHGTGDQLSPAQLADAAAEAVRSLNHAIFPGAGRLAWPSDAYDVLACLTLLAGRLPQALDQLDRYLIGEVEAGRVAVDGGEFAGDPPAAAAAASCWLDQARTAAHRLAHALGQAQQTTAYLAASDPAATRPDEDGCDAG